MANYNRVFRSISDDDLCSDCVHLGYKPGGLSNCTVDAAPELGQLWPAQFDADDYAVSCTYFEQNPSLQHEVKVVQVQVQASGELGSFLSNVQQHAEDLRREAALAQGLLLNRGNPSNWLNWAEQALGYYLSNHERLEGESTPDGEAEMLCDARAAAANQLCEMWRKEGNLLEGLTEEDALAVACLMVDSALIPGFVVRTVNHANGKLVGNRLYAGRKGLNRNLALLLHGMACGLEANGREEEAADFRAASTKAGGGGYQPGDVWVVGDREFRILQVRETSWALPRRAETQRSS